MGSRPVQVVRILLIPEPDEISENALRRLGEIDGLSIELVTDPAIALDTVRRQRCDALVCGMRIGSSVNGLDFLGDVRRLDQIIPVFLFSRDNSPNIISAAFQAGANDYFIADGSVSQMQVIAEAVRVSVEIAALLKDKIQGQRRSQFEEKYENLFDELREGSMIISADTGMITYANESMAESIGRGVNDLINRPLDSLLAQRKGAVSGWKEMNTKAGEGASVVQLAFVHANGAVKTFWTQVRFLELSGRPVLLCQSRDITRLELLEQEISSVRNQLKVIVENSADAIILSREDGLIEFIGGAAPRMFGVSPQDMSIATMDDIFGPQSREVKKIMRQMGDRPRISGIESHIVSRWGTHVPVSVAITRLPSSDKVTRYLFNIMDITNQKVIEAEKLMITELVAIMRSGAGPAEALPKLVEKVRSKVPIEFGLVMRTDRTREKLLVEAVFNSVQAGEIRIGQELSFEYLPAEEELWVREGIMRNNLQQYGLHPLESLLFQEGVRSYLSLPILADGKIIGGVHFGSSRAYALNRGHLSLFSEIASALAGAISRVNQPAEDSGRLLGFIGTLIDLREEVVILCENDMRVLSANRAARELIGGTDPTDRPLDVFLRFMFPEIPAIAGAESTAQLRSADGTTWKMHARQVGTGGYVVTLTER